MCELYDMNELYLKLFKKNKYSKKDYDCWNERIAAACQSKHCFTEMSSQ